MVTATSYEVPYWWPAHTMYVQPRELGADDPQPPRPTRKGLLLAFGALAAVGAFAGLMHHYGGRLERGEWEKSRAPTRRRRTPAPPWMR